MTDKPGEVDTSAGKSGRLVSNGKFKVTVPVSSAPVKVEPGEAEVVTEAMLSAGVDSLCLWDPDDDHSVIVRSVFEAMRAALRTTTPAPVAVDEDALVERLLRKEQRFPAMGGGSIGTDASGKTTSTSYITDDGKRLANPDGPAAVALIRSLQASIRVMESALEEARDVFGKLITRSTKYSRLDARMALAKIDAAIINKDTAP